MVFKIGKTNVDLDIRSIGQSLTKEFLHSFERIVGLAYFAKSSSQYVACANEYVFTKSRLVDRQGNTLDEGQKCCLELAES